MAGSGGSTRAGSDGEAGDMADEDGAACAARAGAPGGNPAWLRALDLHLGRRVREQRTIAGLTQAGLAARIGVTYQQLHKYEVGLNRMSAGTLFALGTVLGQPVNWFYEGFDADVPSHLPRRGRMLLELSRSTALIVDTRELRVLGLLARLLARRGSGGSDGEGT